MGAQIVEEPGSGHFELASDTFKLLADTTRLKILWALLHGEHSVSELADHVGAQPSAVSQQLSKLRMAHLVRKRRDGNRIFYAADNAHVRHLVEEALFHTDHVTQGLPDHDDGRAASAGGRRRAGA